ncbi:low molecular weight protein-tyrosine-phosphatase [Cohnella lupini]|uniref:protein-tyrosine-phosphatase n=1 Tax=Cohnella lupini TaxID=1294267 RepID=A0A3D9IER8_9BACL|nr:low molecular weight protein-tyrosine-phosphatase [Cohnella lupini]RED60282.1 protein-tyrosine phosphatase [Cohnella lupini]
MSYSVLFVCLGNICRSPMAEAVFRHLVKRDGLENKITVDSAGTGDWHIGHPPHEGTRGLLDKLSISSEGMKARQFTSEDGGSFDLIVAMDSKNERDILNILQGSDNAPVIRFMSLLPANGSDDVPDPYYSGNFEEVYELVKDGCEILLERIKGRLEHGE